MTEPDERTPAVSRRAVLGTLSALSAGATGGCIEQLGGVLGSSSPEQLSLTVKSVPADYDSAATRIARQLVENLTTVGIDAGVELQPERELRRDVLVNGEFDIYVGRYPDWHDPDYLRPLLHSVFDGESGWQNPFHFTDIAVDDLLSAQRTQSGSQRESVVEDLQREIASKQPFGIVAFPDEIWAARMDRFIGWSHYSSTEPLSYLALDSADGSDERDQLRVTTTNSEPTENMNPLAPQHRGRGIFTGLLYDPLGRWIDGSVEPWLAEEISWERQATDTVGSVRLRPELRWHDGKPLTAEDVAFTYRFVTDTLLGEGEAPVPAFRLRGRSSLVESVTSEDDRSLKIHCPDTSPDVARRALTVPVLPAHVWRERAVEASVAWTSGSRTVTEALVWANPSPVGSGAVEFDSRAQGESLVLTRFDDHFLHRSSTDSVPDVVAGGVPFDRLSVRVVPSDHAAVQLLSTDEADVTAMRITPGTVPTVGQEDAVGLYVDSGHTFYHVGFNVQNEPLGNPHVRRAIVRLLDKENIAEDIFDGYARPAVSPLAGTHWVPADLEWSGFDPEVPFAGTDGVLDEERAKDMFSEAGFEYGDDERLFEQ